MSSEEKLCQLIREHPDLPVMKLHTEADEDDNYVLKLTDAFVGRWWAYDEYVYDDRDNVLDALFDRGEIRDAEELDRVCDTLPTGECIWVVMDFWDT